MKRIITLHILLLLVTITMAQEPELIGQLNSIIHYNYNDKTGTLEFESKSEFQYGQNKNPKTPNVMVKYYWNNIQQSWVADSGFTYEYNNNGNRILCEARFYDTGKPAHVAWTLAMKKEYEYNENANKSRITTYSWDAFGWTRTIKEEYFYTMDLKDSLSQTFLWDQKQEDWLNYQKTESDYDSLGNKVLATNYEWLENRAMWTIKSKNEYTCDEKGNTIAQLIYNQDEGTGEMNLYIKNEFEYDLSYSKVWDPYNVGHRDRLTIINSIKNNGNGEMLLASTDSLYYTQVETSSSLMEIHTVSDVKIYPNPVTNHITIRSNDEGATFELYSQDGKKVMSCKVQIYQQIDVSRLSKGIFLYKYLSVTGKAQTGKLIKNQ